MRYGAQGSAAPRINVDDEDDDYEFWGVYVSVITLVAASEIEDWFKTSKKVKKVT